MRSASVIIFIALLIDGCVDPFPVPKLDVTPLLVVDGLITTDPGPHFIKLSMSFSLDDVSIDEKPVVGAIVSIHDDQGERITAAEVGPGVYQTVPAWWHAQEGRTYTFHTQLSDGRQFESAQQKVYPAGRIDSLYAKFAPNATVNLEDPLIPQDAFQLFLNASAEANFPNLFRWRWKGTYEIFTRPELRVRVDPDCFCTVPDPLPCSGYNEQLVQVSPCTCCSCWVNDFSRLARVSGNQFVSDNLFRDVNLAKIPVDGLRFYSKYYVEVEQLSLDESSYSFWKLVQAQQVGANDIFQPNVIRIYGNIRNVSNPEDRALGAVSFASVARKSILIDRSEILGGKPSLPILIMDCSNYDATATTTKPPFW